MFSKLKQIFSPANSAEETDNNEQADTITAELISLESELARNPADNNAQKTLMVKYNQAIKIYSSSKAYRHRVDDVFIKMDELRNTIRKNI
ncbi:hypothetical protein [Erwinia sp. JUb26]|uniref:hypothetical protein n=1 Tax=Erwinia sp. JUb26 TaxID=2485126 RepID=UPI000F46A179|nr:hypothetical protein [Erwinia sp. JUb26]ROR06727.1 hypothetical protein EC836_1076 [Erwinia sp. JUb26]